MSAAGEPTLAGALTLSFGAAAGRDAGSLAVDLDRLPKSRMLVQAASGGGKSYLARALLEGTAGWVQQFVLDPRGRVRDAPGEVPVRARASAGEEGDVPAPSI